MSASEFEGHEALIAQLQAGMLGAPDYLRRRVLAAGPGAAKRVRVPKSRRQRAFVLVPVAVGLAVGAGLIYGAVNSGTPRKHSAPTLAAGLAAGRAPRGVAGLNGPTGAAGPTGATGATGMQGVTGETGPVGAQGPTGANGAITHASSSANGRTNPYGVPYSASAHGDALQAGKGDTKLGPVGSTGPTSANGPATEYGLFAAAPPLKGLQTQQKARITTADSLSIPKSRLVHAVADLQVAVANRGALTHATNKATEIVTGLGGYAQNVQYSASRKGYGRAFLDLHVPLSKTQSAIEQLGGLGQLLSQSVSTQDLEQQFKRQTNQIGQLQRAIAIYKQALLSGTLTASQRIEVQIRLANAEHQITGTRKVRGQTVKSGTTAEIRLNLSTNQHAVVVHRHKTGRVGRLLHNAGEFLGLEGVIVLYVLIVATPIVLLVALVWWILRERRRREERLLAANA